MTSLLDDLGIRHPIIQAPMAGVSSPAMAAAVTEAGALGSIGIGASTVAAARTMIADVRQRTDGPFNVNVFVHSPARADVGHESAWIERLRPEFERFAVAPPAALREIYTSFLADDAMLAMLLAERPPAVSFHFGVPPADRVATLRETGAILLASATNLVEARAAAAVGVHAVVAQGWEAGGHRGVFDPYSADERLGTFALTRVLALALEIPVIAAGGIMDGAGIGAALALGAQAAQLGTAFVGCPESLADEGYRAALFSDAAHQTVVTRAISGRPARCLANAFTTFGRRIPDAVIPAYPIAYDAGKALHAAARGRGEFGFGAQWAGQGAPLARAMPAADLVRTLAAEMRMNGRVPA